MNDFRNTIAFVYSFQCVCTEFVDAGMNSKLAWSCSNSLLVSSLYLERAPLHLLIERHIRNVCVFIVCYSPDQPPPVQRETAFVDVHHTNIGQGVNSQTVPLIPQTTPQQYPRKLIYMYMYMYMYGL